MATAAILGVVASLVGPAIELGKCFQKQLNYLCCFQSNVKALDDAAKNLADAEADLQVRVDGAKRNGEQILNQVQTWLAKAEETRLNNTLGIGRPRILNLRSRYSLSRKAIKTAQSMNLLRDTCNFDHVSNPALPASMHHEERPLTPPGWIESRKKTEDDIIIAMRERNAYVIGVCGMGGVGKTTMAKQIMNRAKEREGIFEEVLSVAVGQRVDMLQIQHGILDWLGLKLDEETLAPRAIRLRDRLLSGNRKLIVIDDVWERIDLEELGIPCQSDSCTILLTSRDSHVLRQMNAQRVFTVEILSEEEAWSMFQENVGACLDDDPNLLPTARDVVNECKGLPLALVAVSRALKDQPIKGIWSNALNQLQRNNPEDIPGFIKQVYNPIRLSFNFLESENAKKLLFLCSSFPDDHQISLEHLALYGFGLGILGDINNLEEARNKISGLVDMLKSRFLILEGWGEHYVKMHDVVRDVAIFIASKEKHAILEFTSLDKYSHINDCNMLSLIEKQSQFYFPSGLIFPKLSFLRMYSSEYGRPQSDNILEGMQQLKVLSITNFSLGLTPQTMILLKNLRTLHLNSCKLESLCAVGELTSLEILCCHNCNFITELPVEIGRLHRLRLLEVTDCSRLKTIVSGVISRLGQLEELKVSGGFKGWESKEIKNERSNASLSELQSLSKLTCLEIEIEHWSLDAQVLQLSSKLEKYNIQVGKPTLLGVLPSHEKKLSVILQMSTSLRNWIDVFARTAEYLCLDVVDSKGFDFSGHQNMRCLVFRNCQTVVKLVSSSTDCRFDVFPVLEEMHLESLPKFEEICDGPIPNGSNSFAKLKKISLSNLDGLLHVWRSKNQNILLSNLSTVRISCCGKLRRVFSSSVVIKSLSQLSSLEIENCESMEEVFWIEKDDGNSPSCITFPKLKTLSLSNLDGLLHVWRSKNQNILLSNLSTVRISCCGKLRRVFSSSVVIKSLSQLSSLEIENCESMEEVFWIEKDDGNSPSCITFPKLKTLSLKRLENLTYICKGIDIIEFPQPFQLDIKYCPKLTSLGKASDHQNHVSSSGGHDSIHIFCNTKISFGSLTTLDIEGYENISYLWCHHIPHLFFAQLEWLKVSNISNISNLFTYSIATNLVNLQKLIIDGCNDMSYVVTEDDDAETSKTKPQHIILYKLKYLILYDLPKLQNFCEGRWDLQLPSLKELDIKKVGFYSALECVPLICNTQITFDKLTELDIKGHLGDGDHIKHLFSYSVAKNLVNLKTLDITDFSEMTYVIADDVDDTAKTSRNNPQTIKGCSETLYGIADDQAETSQTKLQPIVFHKLKELMLKGLPKLQNFCEGRCDLQLPSLKQLQIKKVGFYSARECVPLFYNTQITFDKLTHLLIQGHLGDRDQIKHLFSYSVAGNLVNLQILEVSHFSEMVYVIADDEDIAKTSGKNPQTIFHQLVSVRLRYLPKLQNLCDWRWDIRFPSLERLNMIDCPGMEGVTPESIRTQNCW